MNDLALKRHGDIADFSPKQLDLIKRTVAKDLDNDEFDMFIAIAKQNKLDPFRKQIYALVYNKDNPNRRSVSFITSISGYRSVAARSGTYRPDEQAPRVVVRDDLRDPDRNPEGLEYAEVTVYRYGADERWYSITGRAYWEEIAPLKDSDEDFDWVETGEVWPDSGKPKKKRVKKKGASGKRVLDTSGNWGKMPRLMLAKCAEADALRKGWPEDLGAIYIEEEMDQSKVLDLTATEMVEQEQAARRQAALGGPSILLTFEFSEGSQAVPAGKVYDRVEQFIMACESASDVEGFQDFNREAFRQFWAISKNDALALRKRLDERIAELKAKEAEPEKVRL